MMAISPWKRVMTQAVIPVHRTGWRGVLDAIKSAVTGKPRFTSNQQFVLSAWVYSPNDAQISLQLEQAVVRLARMSTDVEQSPADGLKEMQDEIRAALPNGDKVIKVFDERANAIVSQYGHGQTGDLFLIYLAIKLAAIAEERELSEVPAVPPTH